MATVHSPPAPPVEPQKRARLEVYAALAAVLFGAPAAFLFAKAMADSEVRRREAPIAGLLGTRAFEQLSKGEKTPLHYYGTTNNALSVPDFELPDQHGQLFRASDARGQVLVMNFWTITCQPCVEEMPSLVQLAAYADDNPDLTVVAITSDKQWSDVETLFPPDSRLRVLFDPEKKVINGLFGSRLFPETWVVDGNGVIRLRVDGPKDWASPLSLDVLDGFM